MAETTTRTVASTTPKKKAIERDTNSYILKTTFYPTVEKNLKNTTKANEFFKYAAAYRDRNIDILTSIIPRRFLIFERNGEDGNIVFRTCGLDKKEMTAKIKECRQVLKLDQMKSTEAMEICVALIMMMRYYYNDKPKLKMCCMYYTYAIWSLVFKKYFNTFSPNAEVMQYTIDSLNNKFAVKRLGSFEKALEMKMDQVILWAEDRLENLSDKDIIDIINGIRTRLNDMMKKLANQIHKNAAANNRTFVSSETNEETGEMITDRENNIGVTSNLASAYTTKFFTNGVSTKACHTAAGLCSVSENELKTAITLLIRENNVREVKEFYDCIFYSFFQYYPNAKSSDVKTTKFIAAANSIYKKGNSLDKNIKKIKELSHVWLEKGSRTYKATNHAATQNNFRKAIYMYFVLVCASNED